MDGLQAFCLREKLTRDTETGFRNRRNMRGQRLGRRGRGGVDGSGRIPVRSLRHSPWEGATVRQVITATPVKHRSLQRSCGPGSNRRAVVSLRRQAPPCLTRFLTADVDHSVRSLRPTRCGRESCRTRRSWSRRRGRRPSTPRRARRPMDRPGRAPRRARTRSGGSTPDGRPG
jgi:hypothetical protein